MFRTAVIRNASAATAAVSRKLMVLGSFAAPALRATFSSSAQKLAAQPFRMPAMSPTMSVGGIVEWNVKEGQEFAAGDVLLDVETDKAQISVEAADDGVVVKILDGNGSKDIPVGKIVAVLAEPGDDISSIDVKAIVNSDTTKTPAEPATPVNPKPVDTQPSAPLSPPPTPSIATSATGFVEKARAQAAPAAVRVLKENGLDKDVINKINGTGPGGRVLKGDALAFVGAIPSDAPSKLQGQLESRRTLHLENIEIAPSANSKHGSNLASGGTGTGTKEPVPEPLVETKEFLLNAELSANPAAVRALVAKAHRLAFRDMLQSLRPRASVLRDPILDSITSPRSKNLFEVKLHLPVRRARISKVEAEISYGVAEPSQNAKKQVAEYEKLMEVYLQIVAAEKGFGIDLD